MINLTRQSIDRYHFLEPFKRGGMAIVYKACDTPSECQVAFKPLHTKLFDSSIFDQALKHSKSEAQALAKKLNNRSTNMVEFASVLEMLARSTPSPMPRYNRWKLPTSSPWI